VEIKEGWDGCRWRFERRYTSNNMAALKNALATIPAKPLLNMNS